MQTEELHLQPRRRDPNALSRALQPLAPLSCEVVTNRGKSVKLTSAGYVLRYGRSYRLRMVLPVADEEIEELKLINAPQFITQARSIREVSEDGPVWDIPFKVQADMVSGLTRFGLDFRCEELELAVYTTPSSPLETVQYACPIVVGHRWLFASLLFLLGLVTTFVYHAVAFALEPNPPLVRTIAEDLQALLLRPASWWALGGLAIVSVLVSAVVRLATIAWRCRELRARFREAFPKIEERA